MTDRSPASHAEHDLLLIAALAAGDLDPGEREVADRLVATCADCALLAADLQVIAAATAVLPAPARRRDFSLSSEVAARLRRPGWRGLVAGLAGPRGALLRPLATGLTTLGLAGLLLASLPGIPLGGSAAAPATVSAPGASAAPAEAAASPNPGSVESDAANAPAASPLTRDDTQGVSQSGRPVVPAGGQQASPIAFGDGTPGDRSGVDRLASENDPEPADPTPGATSPVVVLSGALLILGLGLFGLRWTARRLSDA